MELTGGVRSKFGHFKADRFHAEAALLSLAGFGIWRTTSKMGEQAVKYIWDLRKGGGAKFSLNNEREAYPFRDR